VGSLVGGEADRGGTFGVAGLGEPRRSDGTSSSHQDEHMFRSVCNGHNRANFSYDLPSSRVAEKERGGA
jgi:hypothetical protein